MSQNPFRCMMLEGLLFSQFANAAAAAMTQKAHMEAILKMKQDAEQQCRIEAEKKQEELDGAFNKDEVIRLAKHAEEQAVIEEQQRAVAEEQSAKMAEVQKAMAARAAVHAAAAEQAARANAAERAAQAPAAPPLEPGMCKCGARIIDDYLFCPKCGSPTKAGFGRPKALEPEPPGPPPGPPPVESETKAALKEMREQAVKAASTIEIRIRDREDPPPPPIPGFEAPGLAMGPVETGATSSWTTVEELPMKVNTGYVNDVLEMAKKAASAAAEANKLAPPPAPAPPPRERPAEDDDRRRARSGSRDRRDRRGRSRSRSRSRSRRRGSGAGEMLAGATTRGQMHAERRDEEERRQPAERVVTGAMVERVRRMRSGGFDQTVAQQMAVVQPSRPPQVSGGTGNHKVLRLPAIQIRALLGKGGQTINDIRNRSGADIKIHHPPQDEFGSVSIVGNIDLVESLMTDALISKGCAGHMLGRMLASTPTTSIPEAQAAMSLNEDEVPIQAHLVGLFIGPAGSGIREIKEQVKSGAVFISVAPPRHAGGPQLVQVNGSGRDEALGLIRARVNALMAGQ